MPSNVRIYIHDTDTGMAIDSDGVAVLLNGIPGHCGEATPQWIKNFERLMARKLLALPIKERKIAMENKFGPVAAAYRANPASVTWKRC